MLLQNGTVQGIRSILCHNSDCSTLKLNQNIEIEDWHLVGSLRMDTKAVFWAPITSEGRREFSGWEWEEVETKKAQESTSAGVIVSWPSLKTAASIYLPSPNNTVYTLHSPCSVRGLRRRYKLESSWPGWLVSSTWVFLGLEKNRYAVWCRLPGLGVTRNLPTKCYNSFTMTRKDGHWVSVS